MSEEIHGADGGDVDDEMLRSAVDVGRFVRLAGDDPEGLVRMMDEYVAETRRMAGTWPNLLQAGEEGEVSEQLHMCKGGAAIFGFLRVMRTARRSKKMAATSGKIIQAGCGTSGLMSR
jgi:hypothetical protein